MAVEFWWDDDGHTIMRMEIGLGTGWDEYLAALDNIGVEMAAAEHCVYLIMEIMGNMPPGDPLPPLRLGMGKLSDIPNLSAVMLVGRQRMSVFGQKVIETLIHLYGNDLPRDGGYFDSVEDARATIARLRQRKIWGGE